MVVYPTFTAPFCTWLLMGFFKALPRGIGEAVIVGGSSLFGAFAKVVIPPSMPAIRTVVIFAFTLTLQESVYALTFVSSAAQKPVTLGGATDLVRGDIYYWGELLAGALIASVPIAIAYNLLLDRFIAGNPLVPCPRRPRFESPGPMESVRAPLRFRRFAAKYRRRCGFRRGRRGG